jgi:hypothetical protein
MGGRNSFLKKSFVFIFIFIIVLFVMISLIRLVQYDQKTVEDIKNKDFDVILIPGQGVENSSEDDVDKRLDFALIKFEEQSKKPILLVSGYGKSYLPREEKDIEAEMMYDYVSEKLIKLGYDPKIYIIKENQSHQTIENVIYSREFLDENQKILVLATTKAYQRTNMVFNELLNKYDMEVVSLEKQTKTSTSEKVWLIGTSFVLGVSTDFGKLAIAKTILFVVDIFVNTEDYIEIMFN